MTTMPAWMAKHPCDSCGTGYGCCSQGWTHNLMCCKDCNHPGRSLPDPWTDEDIVEMWTGQLNPPAHFYEALRRLEAAKTDTPSE